MKIAQQRLNISGRLLSRTVGICLLSAFIIMTGCSQKNANTSSGNIITLEFWTLQLDTFRDTLQPMFLEYEQAHPNVRIHWVDLPFSEGPKRTLTAMMSGHSPDVINLNPDFSAILASRNALVNMNQALSASQKSQYLPIAWQAATLRNTSVNNANADEQRSGPSGITFGLPWYITSSVTLYNKAILKQSGLKSPPATDEALTEFVKTVHEKSGAYGMMPVIAEHGNFLKELQKIGIPIYDKNASAIFATPQGAAHLERFVTLYRNGWIPAETITESHQAAVGRFQAGTLASLLIGPNFLKIVKENAPRIYRETDIAPQFPTNAKAKDFSLMVLVVPVKSTHRKEAVDFAIYMTNAQNQLTLSKTAPVLPSISEVLSDPYFSRFNDPDLMARGRSISARQLLEATSAYQIQPNQNAINDIVDREVQLALLGKTSSWKALRHAQEAINQLRD